MAPPLLDEMGKRGLQKGLVSYGGTIDACSQSADEAWSTAIRLLQEMLWSLFSLDAVHYTAAISSQCKQWEGALGLLERMAQQLLMLDAKSFSASIS